MTSEASRVPANNLRQVKMWEKNPQGKPRGAKCDPKGTHKHNVGVGGCRYRTGKGKNEDSAKTFLRNRESANSKDGGMKESQTIFELKQ